MTKYEKIISLWFEMWLIKKDLGIMEIFSDDAVYIESWGPQYHGAKQICHWFDEWNKRGDVLAWDIKRFFVNGKSVAVEWYFKNIMHNGKTEEFDGVSVVDFDDDGKISFLQEYGCNIKRYNPYEDGENPHFEEQSSKWF